MAWEFDGLSLSVIMGFVVDAVTYWSPLLYFYFLSFFLRLAVSLWQRSLLLKRGTK